MRYTLYMEAMTMNIEQVEHNTLYVVYSNGVWYADFRETDEKQSTIDLFGSPLVPTAFTGFSPVETVVEQVGKLNPQYKVKAR